MVNNGASRTLRPVADEELLGRAPVNFADPEIRTAIEGQTILVTGAAGSIGSELCRQIARFAPAALVAFDIAETPLFDLDQQMRQRFPQTRLYTEIGNIQNRARVDEVFRRYAPSVCYHAAAYKHVPLMEEHVFEAVENNVFGTANVAAAAVESGAAEFALISSDKAVRPSSMMGATKRVAELLLSALDAGSTRCIAVRFGNVLGSPGSVLPIFRRQLAAGGPITITHPDMSRFFMTEPEACQLVLQASTIASHCQICVLDMGQQIRIVDLARKLITLSGLRPEIDVRIEFTGIRPGEKLSEELSTLLEHTVPTSREHVRVLVGDGHLPTAVASRIEVLRAACRTRDITYLLQAVRDLVPEYSPSAELSDRAARSILAKPLLRD